MPSLPTKSSPRSSPELRSWPPSNVASVMNLITASDATAALAVFRNQFRIPFQSLTHWRYGYRPRDEFSGGSQTVWLGFDSIGERIAYRRADDSAGRRSSHADFGG